MVLAKSKNAVGLGNSLMNDRFGKGKGSDRRKVTAAGIHRIDHATGETYVTNERKEASWVKMKSVTEQAALDEFLSTAELAGTDFTAEKMNHVKIIQSHQTNPNLLSSKEERELVGKQAAYKDRLTVPRRPKWDLTTTPEQLDAMERNSLLDWRRGIAELQQNHDLLMTPFERNLEVWRQLWRVIERSDLVIQIVDARNPLLFRSEDLERYVKEIHQKKKNLLLVNKADLLTLKQRQAWADYFKAADIQYKFFSASLAKELNEAGEFDTEIKRLQIIDGESCENGMEKYNEHDCTKILNVYELEALFLQNAPKNLDSDPDKPPRIQIGLVGYPNVGKSSTINALIGAKKVSVSSTPGKTKHFQTIHLSENVLLCDCPGLVFPNFAKTKAELVCNGILPIDQLREFTGPVSLVTQRIPQYFIEALYTIKITTRPLEEGGTGVPTAEELLIAYAKSRGFTRSGQGQPDESRAARYILKDYVSGKILFCHPPPQGFDPIEFNMEHYGIDCSNKIKKLETDYSADKQASISGSTHSIPELGLKSKNLDSNFFASGQGNAGHLRMPFNYQYSQQGKVNGKLLSQRKQSTLSALDKDIDPEDITILTSKKHFKGGKKGNGKRRQNYFED